MFKDDMEEFEIYDRWGTGMIIRKYTSNITGRRRVSLIPTHEDIDVRTEIEKLGDDLDLDLSIEEFEKKMKEILGDGGEEDAVK